MPLVTLKVKVEDIVTSDESLHLWNEEEIKYLAESFVKDGQLTPIGILADGKLCSGFRRVAAAKLLGWKELKCVVYGTDDRLMIDD